MNNIIEPCCAERQLGQLLREAHGQAALFQTNGDVTAKLFIKDTMLLSGDRPRTLTIAASEIPQEALRLISRYAQLGYIATLRLMLHESAVRALHPAFLDCEVQLAMLPDNKPIPELMMWRGSSHTVVIQGTMPDTVSPALHLYGGQLGGNNSPAIRAATSAFEALFRARRVESLSPDPSPEGEGSEDSESTVLGDSVADNTSALSPQPSDVSHQTSTSSQPSDISHQTSDTAADPAAKKRKKKSEI